MKMIAALLFISSILHGDRVHIVSSFSIDANEPFFSSASIMRDTGFDICLDEPGCSIYSFDVTKVLVMNPCYPRPYLASLPREKLVLFNWEPVDEIASYCEYY